MATKRVFEEEKAAFDTALAATAKRIKEARAEQQITETALGDLCKAMIHANASTRNKDAPPFIVTLKDCAPLGGDWIEVIALVTFRVECDCDEYTGDTIIDSAQVKDFGIDTERSYICGVSTFLCKAVTEPATFEWGGCIDKRGVKKAVEQFIDDDFEGEVTAMLSSQLENEHGSGFERTESTVLFTATDSELTVFVHLGATELRQVLEPDVFKAMPETWGNSSDSKEPDRPVSSFLCPYAHSCDRDLFNMCMIHTSEWDLTVES